MSKSTIYDYKDELNKIYYYFNISYLCSIHDKPRQLLICWEIKPHLSLVLTIIIGHGCFTIVKEYLVTYHYRHPKCLGNLLARKTKLLKTALTYTKQNLVTNIILKAMDFN